MQIVTAIVGPGQVSEVVGALAAAGHVPVAISSVQSNWLPARRMLFRGIESADTTAVRLELILNDADAEKVTDLICACAEVGAIRSEAVVWSSTTQMAGIFSSPPAPQLI